MSDKIFHRVTSIMTDHHFLNVLFGLPGEQVKSYMNAKSKRAMREVSSVTLNRVGRAQDGRQVMSRALTALFSEVNALVSDKDIQKLTITLGADNYTRSEWTYTSNRDWSDSLVVPVGLIEHKMKLRFSLLFRGSGNVARDKVRMRSVSQSLEHLCRKLITVLKATPLYEGSRYDFETLYPFEISVSGVIYEANSQGYSDFSFDIISYEV